MDIFNYFRSARLLRTGRCRLRVRASSSPRVLQSFHVQYPVGERRDLSHFAGRQKR